MALHKALEFKPAELKEEITPEAVLAAYRATRAISLITLAEGFLNNNLEQSLLLMHRLPFSTTEADNLDKWMKQKFPDICAEDEKTRSSAIENASGRVLALFGLIEKNNKTKILDLKYLPISAEKKDGFGLFLLGELKSIEEDVYHATPDLHQRAVENGCPMGYLFRPRSYCWGKRAVTEGKIEKAMEAGVPDAFCIQGSYLVDGCFGFKKNLELGKRMYAVSAIKGSTEGLFLYADHLKHPLKWQLFRLACEAGFVDAQHKFRGTRYGANDIEKIYHEAMTFKDRNDSSLIKLCLSQPGAVDQLATEYGDKAEDVLSLLTGDDQAKMLKQREQDLCLIMSNIDVLPRPLLELILGYFSLFAPKLQPGYLEKEVTAKATANFLASQNFNGLTLFSENHASAQRGEMSYLEVMRKAFQWYQSQWQAIAGIKNEKNL